MQQFGFIAPEKKHIVEAVTVEVIGGADSVEDPELPVADGAAAPQVLDVVEMY